MNLTGDGWVEKKNRQWRQGLGICAEGAPVKLNYWTPNLKDLKIPEVDYNNLELGESSGVSRVLQKRDYNLESWSGTIEESEYGM